MTLLPILGLSSLLFLPAAHADDDPMPPSQDAVAQDDDEEEGDEEGEDDGDTPDDEGWYARQKKEQRAQEEQEEPKAPPQQKAASGQPVKWDGKPFLEPVVGASVYSTGGHTWPSLSLGAQAGLRYWQSKPDPFLIGTGRVAGEYLLGSGVKGLEVRVGNFIGPWWKFVGLQTGPDVFWNKYTYGSLVLDPLTGLAWPLMALMDLKIIDLHGGLEPAWYLSSTDRSQMDWATEDSFGFGHEFTWFAGATLHLKVASVGVNWSRRTTADGIQQGYGVGLKVGG